MCFCCRFNKNIATKLGCITIKNSVLQVHFEIPTPQFLINNFFPKDLSFSAYLHDTLNIRNLTLLYHFFILHNEYDALIFRSVVS